MHTVQLPSLPTAGFKLYPLLLPCSILCLGVVRRAVSLVTRTTSPPVRCGVLRLPLLHLTTIRHGEVPWGAVRRCGAVRYGTVLIRKCEFVHMAFIRCSKVRSFNKPHRKTLTPTALPHEKTPRRETTCFFLFSSFCCCFLPHGWMIFKPFIFRTMFGNLRSLTKPRRKILPPTAAPHLKKKKHRKPPYIYSFICSFFLLLPSGWMVFEPRSHDDAVPCVRSINRTDKQYCCTSHSSAVKRQMPYLTWYFF